MPQPKIATQGTAVVCMELQRGVVGDLSSLTSLRDVVEQQNIIAMTRNVLEVARTNSVPVVHCTAEFRQDRRGSGSNAPMLEYMQTLPGHIECGSPAAMVVPELGPAAEDLVVSRLHGVSPFTGTALDPILRNLKVSTLLVAGVSVNIGILGLVIEAVNRGYRVVLLEDAVAGYPAHYVDDVKRYTLRHLASFMRCRDILAQWSTR